MALTVPRLRAVNAAAISGSFAAAARMLGVSQPAVSQHVRDIEAEFGVRLFERVNGVLQPTPLCLELCNIAERISEDEREALRILMRQNTLVDGRLSIGLGNTMPGMALIATFNARYPGIEMAVQTGSHTEITRAVVAHEADIGILPDVPSDGRFRRQRLMRQNVVAIVHPDHELAYLSSVSCARLMKAPLIFRTRGSSTQRVVDRAFRTAGLDPEPLLQLDTRDGVYEAVANGLGVGFMWRYGTSRTDAVRRVPVRELDTEYEEVVFTRADEKSVLLTAFFEAAERFRQHWKAE